MTGPKSEPEGWGVTDVRIRRFDMDGSLLMDIASFSSVRSSIVGAGCSRAGDPE